MNINSTIAYFSSYKLEQILNIEFDPRFLPVVATSFTLFLILYKFINPFLSNLLVKTYGQFTETQQIDWSTRYTTHEWFLKSFTHEIFTWLGSIHRLIHLLLVLFVCIWWLLIMDLMQILFCKEIKIYTRLYMISFDCLDIKVIYWKQIYLLWSVIYLVVCFDGWISKDNYIRF